jgi:hypothetical protein
MTTKGLYRQTEDLLVLDKYKDAIALVNAELERDGPTPMLIFTLADVLSQQGYRGRAEKVLSEYLSKVDTTNLSPEDITRLDLMNMQLAFLTPWNTAIFGPSLRSAIEIREKHSSKLLESDWDSGNPVSVCLTSIRSVSLTNLDQNGNLLLRRHFPRESFQMCGYLALKGCCKHHEAAFQIIASDEALL